MTFQEGFGRHAVRLRDWDEVQETVTDASGPTLTAPPELAGGASLPLANPAFLLEEDEEKRKPMMGWEVRFSGVAALFFGTLVVMGFVLGR
ncbi:hypothetical protein E7T06_09510 [Deinococcus sp. Arct2-2]|uniref:hypothetical protein n=1 Tax=Deinococcus sp. Arct2-2 TaxID=2568653 RepID=UPI0010A30E55|nr:hypothetical protein [Deinococcus sp. Arct2-2]THF69982.1 hypothetical protein E7T06_09510 [Deinococcus sp. Arct2-2]